MNDCENMLNRSALLQNAIKRRNFLHDGSCVKFPYGQRDMDSSITSNSTVNSATIGNGNNVEDASTDSNDSVSIVNNTSEMDNAVNGINGNVNTASNSSDVSKEHSNCDPPYMVPFPVHPDAIIVKKPLCRLDYSARNTAIGSLPTCNSDLWTVPEQDDGDNENDGDDDDDAADDDDKNYDNCDSDYDNENVVGNGIWWALEKKENNRLVDVKGSETETVREGDRRGGDGVCVEREKKNNEKEKNNSSSGDEKSDGGNITKEESKAGWQEDGEKGRKWEATREVKEEGEAQEKKKEEEQEALTPNCYSSNEYEFETASEGIGLLEVKVEKQLCGTTVHSPTMLRLTTTTASCNDSAPTNVTWSDPCRDQSSDTKRQGNNLKKIKETTAMPKHLETDFNTENHCDENVPLIETVTSQQRVNDPALAALPSPLLPCPPSLALPLATHSSPAPSIPPHSNHPKHHHHQNFPQQQQKHKQQSHAHFLLPPEANLTVSTNSVPSCGNNSPVSTVSASSTTTTSSSSSSSSSSSPSCPSSPKTTHSSVVQEDKPTKEEDPFHTEVLDSNPDYPTTGHSINDIIKMSLEDYVVLKDEENRRLSVEVIPTANNKPRQSYSKMVLQNMINGTENVMVSSSYSVECTAYYWWCLVL
ncbi:Hypothetical predicted protein [Octopus vulgaris]|uniref:Uncharacterized protein n=1 Tax=Octopus vulgaris TaxID=6645 RepID=A0AA36ANR6_OCTVU|nr:Hypothetical predicted protein [Octopus vulgaris]